MFDYIKGKLISKDNGKAVVEANSIGWCFEISVQSHKNLPEEGENVKIYTLLIHKEDTMKLYGFSSREEREIFSTLTSISGVGAKIAFALLDKLSCAEIVSCVLNKDIKNLSKAKGIGEKMAQKIVFELRGKFKNQTDAPVSKIRPKEFEEARGVLLGLGYSAKEADFGLEQALKDPKNKTAEELLRESLKILALN